MRSQYHFTRLAAIVIAWINTAAGAAQDTFQADCATLAPSLNIPNTTAWFSQYVAAGTNLTFPDNDPTCDRPSQVVSNDLCRVALFVETSDRSNISMEAWLPSNWTGRFLSTGNGGLSGCIQYEDLAYTAALGFATVGANNGHNGSSGEPFYKNPEVLNDFGYRSVHTNVVVGKEITKDFYGQAHNKSYYLGCSTGGRQGMKSAQTFPDDFDGIVAGAPAVAFNNLTSWSGTFYIETGLPNSTTFVPPNLWAGSIHADILNQCDGLDGAVDGIIEDPLLCDYRPESLICNSTATNDTSNCLTPIQTKTVRQTFSPTYGNNGSLVYPRMQPGSEANGAAFIYYAGTPFPFTSDWFRYAVYNDPNWDPATLNPTDYDNAYRANPGDVETWLPLTDYQTRGGKLLHYHGQADPVISSDNSPRYYDYQARTLGESSASLDQFYRFFRISGMSHCEGGDGAAWRIGQTSSGNATLDPDGNVLMAMVRWVEEGIAPETITGYSLDADGSQPEGGEVVRAHCRYPLRNVYVGPGPAREAENWKCVQGF